MALTDAQKAQVRRYLGFPDVNRDASLEGVLTSLSAEGETLVGTILTALDSIQTRLTASQGRQSIIQVEDVKFSGGAEIRSLWAEGNRLVQDLAAIIDVAPRRLPFDGGGGTRPTYRG